MSAPAKPGVKAARRLAKLRMASSLSSGTIAAASVDAEDVVLPALSLLSLLEADSERPENYIHAQIKKSKEVGNRIERASPSYFIAYVSYIHNSHSPFKCTAKIALLPSKSGLSTVI